MGKQNDAMFKYLEDEKRFADLFNALQFEGEQVVNPQKLKEASEHYAGSASHKRRGRFRDVKKRLENGASLRILAVENQNQVDYTMPWRIMEYDNLEYGKQIQAVQSKNEREQKESGAEKLTPAEWLCKFRKSNRLAPVYTICLYHGQEKWDGPRSLRDMMDFGEDRKHWEEAFADYPMRLVCVNEMQDFSYFKSSLGQLFEAMTLRGDKKALETLYTERAECQHLDRETAEAIMIMTGNKKMLEHIEDYSDGEGGYSMCKAMKELVEDAKQDERRAVLVSLVKDGLLSSTEAASRVGMPESEFIKLLG